MMVSQQRQGRITDEREKRRVGEQIEPGGRPKAPGSEEPRLSETEIGPRNGMTGTEIATVMNASRTSAFEGQIATTSRAIMSTRRRTPDDTSGATANAQG
jgi:hypothetical protein